jgi:DNA-binding NtrC family response regulator
VNKDSGPFLIVDDEPEMCWALERILKGAGGTCRTAYSAKEAVALAERQSFCTAFLDAKLPDNDGLDLARRLLESKPGIRIVIVSGYFYQDDPIITEAIQSGLIAAFVAKPFARDEILRAIGSPPFAHGDRRP